MIETRKLAAVTSPRVAVVTVKNLFGNRFAYVTVSSLFGTYLEMKRVGSKNVKAYINENSIAI
jgi:hypothetical protein